MGNRWLINLGVVYTWKTHKQKKAEQAHQRYLTERREGLSSSILKLNEIIGKLVLECGPIGLNDEFIEEAKLALVYAIGEVLSAQGTIYPEQEATLKILFSNLNPTYNYAQFSQAAIYRIGVYEQYWDIVGLEEKSFGSLWRTIFELIYRSRLLDTLQAIDDQLGLIVINFCFLGDTDSPFAKPICDRILRCLNAHVNAYQQTPYIHALLLLQEVLLAQRSLAIEDHFLLRDTDIIQDDRNYYVFNVYKKFAKIFCGKFAVREIDVVKGKLDYEHDMDIILVWNNTKCNYELLYQE